MEDEKQKLREAVEQAKADNEASGINALMRDVRLSSEQMESEAKAAGSKFARDLETEAENGAQKLKQDARDTFDNAKASFKQSVGETVQDVRRVSGGVCNLDRFAKADKLIEKIKEPEAEADDELYVPRKRARYQ